MKKLVLPVLLFAMAITTVDAFAQQGIKLRAKSNAFAPKFEMPSWAVEGKDYVSKKINLKVKPEFRYTVDTHAELQAVLTEIGAQGALVRMFPKHNAPEIPYLRPGKKMVDLSLVYELRYTSGINIQSAIAKLEACGIFEYVEPHYIGHIFAPFTPNDTGVGSEHHLSSIQAYDAWGVNSTTARGDSTVAVIGVVDSGTNFGNSDLSGKVKKNLAEIPNNNVDDDNDGYVDNYNGWDFGDSDKDPSYDPALQQQGGYHGVATSSLAAAATNNGYGMAGVGFNCKFVPVKVMNSQGALTDTYLGMIYAADHGCNIINCSFGGASFGSLGQEVVNYCAINKQALVVAATGDTLRDELNYPASYENVLSVSGTAQSSLGIWNSGITGATYNYLVDVCAPAANLYALAGANFQSGFYGTSGSAPIVAGAAAIVKSYYPSYTMEQVAHVLKVTADDMYGSNGSTYANKLGSGRINLYKALTVTNKPSIGLDARVITDGNDNTPNPSETINIVGTFMNFLAPTSNLTVSISSPSPYVTAVGGSTSATLGALNTLATATNTANPFKFTINANVPKNHTVFFKLTYTDAGTGYSAFEYFTLQVNVDYVNLVTPDVSCSITSAGLVGYNLPNAGEGVGFTYSGATTGGGTLIYEGGLVLGTSGTKLSNCIRNDKSNTQDLDFKAITKAHSIIPSTLADVQVQASFNDDGNTSGKLNVQVDQDSYGFSSTGNTKYIIHSYKITNKGSSALTGLYAGMFVDYDVDYDNYLSDKVAYDANNKMIYAYSTVANMPYAGTKLLSSVAAAVPYAIDNITSPPGGSVNIYDGFTKAEKFTTLSTSRTSAGGSGAGNDIATMLSTGPLTLGAGESTRIGFALIAGDNLSDIQTSATNAQTKWGNITLGVAESTNKKFNLWDVYPNPMSQTATVGFTLEKPSQVELTIIDMLGQTVSTVVKAQVSTGDHQYTIDASNLTSGVYYYQLIVNDEVTTKKVSVVK